MNPSDVVRSLTGDRSPSPGDHGRAFAPANIALCKYWGKRDDSLNLPVTSSLSVSLGNLGATTTIRLCDGPDRVSLNGVPVESQAPFAKRLSAFLDLFRTEGAGYHVDTESTVPVAAGLASSASGFAALVLALDALYGWALDRRALSILARLGSGSACRSVYDGFVEWHAGARADGMDSHAEPLDAEWPQLRIGWLALATGAKPVGSRAAMQRTRETSALYAAWPEKAADDLVAIRQAIRDRSFDALGPAVESNALAMHATMWAAWPPVGYWLPETVHVIREVWAAREDGLSVYLTMDAGPNVKLLFVEADRERVEQRFPSLQVVNR